VPFTKVGKNKYKSPSGRTFTKKQVAMYYATDGFKKSKIKRDTGFYGHMTTDTIPKVKVIGC